MTENNVIEKQAVEDHITRIHLDGKEYILIGTAHVSKQSAEQVKEVIERERPDAVCVELDEHATNRSCRRRSGRKPISSR